MSNPFWNFTTALVAGTLAKAADVNALMTGIGVGFDTVDTTFDQTFLMTAADGTFTLTENAAARANKYIAFDGSGDAVLYSNVLPTSLVGDALEVLRVNAGETAYEHWDILADDNDWTGVNEYTSGYLKVSSATTHAVFEIEAGGAAGYAIQYLYGSGTGNPEIWFYNGASIQALLTTYSTDDRFEILVGPDPNYSYFKIYPGGEYHMTTAEGDSHLKVVSTHATGYALLSLDSLTQDGVIAFKKAGTIRSEIWQGRNTNDPLFIRQYGPDGANYPSGDEIKLGGGALRFNVYGASTYALFELNSGANGDPEMDMYVNGVYYGNFFVTHTNGEIGISNSGATHDKFHAATLDQNGLFEIWPDSTDAYCNLTASQTATNGWAWYTATQKAGQNAGFACGTHGNAYADCNFYFDDDPGNEASIWDCNAAGGASGNRHTLTFDAATGLLTLTPYDSAGKIHVVGTAAAGSGYAYVTCSAASTSADQGFSMRTVGHANTDADFWYVTGKTYIYTNADVTGATGNYHMMVFDAAGGGIEWKPYAKPGDFFMDVTAASPNNWGYFKVDGGTDGTFNGGFTVSVNGTYKAGLWYDEATDVWTLNHVVTGGNQTLKMFQSGLHGRLEFKAEAGKNARFDIIAPTGAYNAWLNLQSTTAGQDCGIGFNVNSVWEGSVAWDPSVGTYMTCYNTADFDYFFLDGAGTIQFSPETGDPSLQFNMPAGATNAGCVVHNSSDVELGGWDYTTGGSGNLAVYASVNDGAGYYNLLVSQDGGIYWYAEGTTTVTDYTAFITAGSDDDILVNKGYVTQEIGQDLGEFTVANLPAASSYPNYWALATNASGGRTVVRSNGTDWKVIAVEGATVTT